MQENKTAGKTLIKEGNAPRVRRTKREIWQDSVIKVRALERILSKPLTMDERIYFENELAKAEAKL